MKKFSPGRFVAERCNGRRESYRNTNIALCAQKQYAYMRMQKRGKIWEH